MRQLLDLEPAWAAHDVVFVTEDTALGRSLAQTRRVRFVPHFALGQARLGAPGRMLRAAAAGLAAAFRIVLSERPEVVITTGAGAVFPVVLLARAFGARVVVIESFARFDGLSAFYKAAAPLAHARVVQSRALAGKAPGAAVFDPLRTLDEPRPPKRPLLFATVGATLPFDRLVRTVAAAKAEGLVPEAVLAQVGEGGTAPDGLDCVESLPFDQVQDTLRDADIVVCHGGTGSLITALRQGCRVVAMPRRFDRGEHYDDHQAEITAAFAARGLISVADETPEGFARALAEARERPPVRATTDPRALIEHLQALLDRWRPERRKGRGGPGPS